MIPLTLALTDFLSYKQMPEPLDLSDIQIACLSGRNGHGKSALLDAMTWVLWGKARGCEGGQEQERVIRAGANEARVEMTFELEGQTYRVIRSRSRRGKGEIHLAVADGSGGWTDLGGESLTQTQAAISKLLKMEYETFVASAYILQGRADEFSRMNAADRKDTLGKILGLEVYERLAERSRERRREQSALADALRSDAERDEALLAEIPVQEVALSDARAAASAAETERDRAQVALTEAQERLAHARAVEQTLRQVDQRRTDAVDALAAARAEIEAAEQQVSEAHAVARAGDEHRALAAQRPALEADDRGLDEARVRAADLTEEIAGLQTRIAVERKRIESERDANARAAREIQAEIDAVAGAQDLLARATETLAEMDALAAERESLLERHRDLESVRAREHAAAQARAERRAEIADRSQRLSEADASCPVCDQPLGDDHRGRITSEIEATLAALDAADRDGANAMAAVEAELAAVKQHGLEIKQRLAKRSEIEATAATLAERIARAAELALRMEAARASATELDRMIANDLDSPTEREKLASMLAERGAIGYDEAAHRQLRERLDAARVAERSLQAAEHAAARIETLTAQIATARERASAAEAVIAQTDAEGLRIREQLGDLASIETAVAEAQSRVEAAQRSAVEQHTSAARASERLAALAEVAERAKQTRDQHDSARKAAGRYEKLAKAFGRDGIPARIIANAIPDLEREANRLLDLLTDHRLTVKIELHRPAKTGGKVKDTLDITVWNGGENRPYEMYSGGERLRVDFALRIALSRLLARRASTRLETLVIDEGFGSQDAEGRVRLVEAILKVRSDFRRVLVITHMEELKDLFPVRLEVSKDPVAGSAVRVV